MTKNVKRKVQKTIGFSLLLVLLFGIVLVLMISSKERWFAYLILAACVGLLVFLRSTKFWRGWRVPLCWILAIVVAWTGLFAGQPSTNIQPYTPRKLEQPSASYQLLLNNVTIVDTRTGNLTSNMSILCVNGKIKDIAPAGTIKADNDTKIIDATGRYVVPGYLNMHMHVIGEENTSESLALLLANGVTGFRQMSGSVELLEEWRSGAFTSSTNEPALLTMPGDIMTPMNAPTPEIAVKFVRQQQEEGADFIKIGGVSPDVFNAIQAEANKLGIPVEGHVLPDMDLKEVSKNGFHSVEHFGINFGALISSSTDEKALRAQATGIPTTIMENPIFVHLMRIKGLQNFVNEQFIKWGTKTSGGAKDETQLTHFINTYNEEKAKELADVYVQYNTWQCPTMIRMLSGLFKGSSEATAQRLYDLYLSLVRTYDLEGVKMMAGTDGSEGDAIHKEFDELEKAGISPLHVLQMTTLNGAEFLGRLDDMGTVEVGKNADLVLLDANPVESVQNFHKIHSVIRAGSYHDKDELNAIKDKFEKK
ncbi:amidohydrolase family protein [Paenibacillus sp. 19GGS1-52]|uniref:amidohydrolase family protein n=1 Tax=Paenibacillus sp. 19GGS1-52 TaxID=2758563 RepID=UPI001EFA5924|nr:amidohydrolase family protein [Paenibacillus sp. 19GGS1-52]ULO06242.1 amidohydrolase family protein [Paenibacillus sp. 19GGS1-52]